MNISKQIKVSNTNTLVSLDTSAYQGEAYCEIVDSNLPNPEVVDVYGNGIRLKFEPACLNHTVKVLIQFPAKKQEFIKEIAKEENLNLKKELKNRILITLVCFVLSMIVGSGFNYAYKRFFLTKEDSWKPAKQAAFEVTKDHNEKKYYNSKKIKQLEKDYKELNFLPDDFSFKEFFFYTEEGVYIMRDAARFNDGSPYISTREQATAFCEDNFDGRILKDSEYNRYIFTDVIHSLKSPFNKAKDIAEWTSETHPDDNDYYKILTKKLAVEGSDFKLLDGFTYGEEGEIGAGFRCAFYDDEWKKAE